MSDSENLPTLPLLPIKRLFPSLLLPLNVGRSISIAAVEAALASESKEIAVEPAR